VDVHTRDTVLTRDPLFRRAAEGIEVLGNANGSETDRLQYHDELCLRQSAGDSTSPEINIAPDRLGQFVCDDDVPVEELTTRLENPKHFGECLSLIWGQIQHAVADDEVDAPRIDW
jgi:hypothetical protein